VTFQMADGRGEYVVLCAERCVATLIRYDVKHECVLHRDHLAVVAHHMCNCGITWAEDDPQ